MRRDSDTPEIDAMAGVTHLLYCVPILRPGASTHRGADPTDDAYCRSYARFLVSELREQGWTLTKTGGVG